MERLQKGLFGWSDTVAARLHTDLPRNPIRSFFTQKRIHRVCTRSSTCFPLPVLYACSIIITGIKGKEGEGEGKWKWKRVCQDYV